MKKQISKHEYQKLVEEKAPGSHFIKNLFAAFITGGAICAVGQIVMLIFENFGADKELSASATSIIMIFIGAFLTGINIYDEIGKFGGAGASVPITGFSNSIVSPAMEFKKEGHVMGVGAKMFLIAGPVLVYGIFASVIAGLFYFIWKQVM
ncbi:MAG TPA: SpoVA/SpoVAEb family sporulation membrane protein [Clostridiaceae bacterium]|nr:SpoVA/SpoVAEb family sporulation membrane protein [Clostridiaceae bacterium]